MNTMLPQIIAIHGAVANAATWLPIQRELGDAVEFIAPDLPGHGTNREQPFELEKSLALLEKVAEHVDPDRPLVLVGDSLGGYLGILLAARLQKRVDALVMGGASFAMDGVFGALAALTDPPVSIAGLVLGKKRLETLLGRALYRLTDARTADAIIARGLSLPSRSRSLRALRGIDFLQLVRTITCPIYVVNGAYDLPTAWFTRSFAASAVEGYAVIIPGAWHGCMLTHPQECAEVLRTALMRAQRRPQSTALG